MTECPAVTWVGSWDRGHEGTLRKREQTMEFSYRVNIGSPRSIQLVHTYDILPQ